MFLDSLHGDPIGFSVLGIFVIEKNTILTVRQSAVDVCYFIDCFCLRDSVQTAVYAVAWCLSVCPSSCLTRCVICVKLKTDKRIGPIVQISAPPDDPIILTL